MARYPGLVRSVYTGLQSKAFRELPEQRLWDLKEAAQAFGKNAGQTFAARPSQDDRVREFRTLVTDAFKQDAEAALFLNNEVVPRLAALDTPSEWDHIAWWIAYGKWPEPPGIHIPDGVGITFGKRFVEQPSEFSDRFNVYRLMLLTPSSISVDQELFNLWKESYVDRRTAPDPSPRLALPTVGLSISAEAGVAAAAPILVLFQLLFLVHWERRHPSINAADLEAFAFPSYACPSDPLNGPMPKTLGEVVQRLVWTLFLIFPTALLTVGLLSRYDIIYPLVYFGNGKTMTLFLAEQWARSEDFASSTLDWIAFACLALSALAVLSITQSRVAREARVTRWRVVSLVGWLVAITAAVACVRTTLSAFDAAIAPLANASDVHFKMHYLAAFGVFWSVCVGVACQRRARFLALLSVAGFAVFVLHFVPL
ncbi:MAG: hypothetical protein HYZ50_20900 [Deltaproteobacteria bacterium]|nr:hypothetical protein [Deltaproteobacteria bacterium]